MKVPFRKGDALADAQAEVDKLDGQRSKLTARLSDLSSRLDIARAARRDALVAGDLDDIAMATIDKAFAETTEAHAFVEEEIAIITTKRDEAHAHLTGLQDAARRTEIVADCDRRAVALDAAAEALAGAAEAFGEARTAMAKALSEHGVRISSTTGADGSAPVWQLAQPMVMAAVRLAAPGVLPLADGFGDPHVADPLIAMRRAQSGKLRDHADDIRDGRTPAVEMPRPGSTASTVGAASSGPAAPAPADHAVVEPMTRTVFAVPVMFTGAGGLGMVQAEPGDFEVPVRVARKAEELELAFPPDSAEGRAITARMKASGGQYRARARTYVDTSAEADLAPASAARMVTTTWPDERGCQA